MDRLYRRDEEGTREGGSVTDLEIGYNETL